MYYFLPLFTIFVHEISLGFGLFEDTLEPSFFVSGSHTPSHIASPCEHSPFDQLLVIRGLCHLRHSHRRDSHYGDVTGTFTTTHFGYSSGEVPGRGNGLVWPGSSVIRREQVTRV